MKPSQKRHRRRIMARKALMRFRACMDAPVVIHTRAADFLRDAQRR